MKVKRILTLLSILISFSAITKAQETVSTSGNDAIGSGGVVNYTVGQIAYKTYSGVTGSISEGVQQRYNVAVTLGENLKDIELEITSFPNPTNDYLRISITENFRKNLRYELANQKGMIIQEGNLDTSTRLNMSRLAASMYIISVKDNNNKVLKSIKVIKN